MKFGVGILVHNAIKHFRFDLVEQTIESVKEAFPTAELIVFDNGSNDGTEQLVAAMKEGFCYVPADGNTSPGRGMNVIAQELLCRQVDVIVHSDDDMLWYPGAQQKLEKLWLDVSPNLVLVSGYLEPCWEWNTPRYVLENSNGSKVLVRDSAPSCAWSYRATSHQEIFPLKEAFGQDHDACTRLREKNLLVGELDLAEHKGWDYSTWGNKAITTSRPLDRAKWGI